MEKSIQQIIDSEELITSQEFRLLRNYLGKSQEELAFDLGYQHKSNISHYETGKTKVDVPLDYMMKGLVRSKSDV
tara:strand:+ start:876 stop:1100 length:225 start_codon:yes stop_codon:yes gene_type:complete